jgi:hypothetical protein
LSGRGLCDELITRPEESYRLWCVVMCDLETSRIGAPYIYIYIYIYNISSLRVKALISTDLKGEKVRNVSIIMTFLACSLPSLNCVILCIELCCSVYFLCVNVYCTTATGWLPNYS